LHSCTTTTTQTITTTLTSTSYVTTTTNQTSASYIYQFNVAAAVGFYENLSTPVGLFTDYPGSHTIWFADDQALDYYALLKAYDTTHNDTALTLAQQVNDSVSKWGGFFRFYNLVFVVIGQYPPDDEVMCANAQPDKVGSSQGYTINATVFSSCPGFQYSLFADHLAYHVISDLHSGNPTKAESDFSELNSTWDGYGLRDQPFEQDPTHTYQSYKLADYIIAWKSLADNPATAQFAQKYLATVQSVEAVMSKLQSSTGGVWTGYRVTDGQVVYGNGISLTNGETTSLFVLAE
jgi:hypothetical protein